MKKKLAFCSVLLSMFCFCVNSTMAGDFNGDGYDDIVVGAPGEAIGSISTAGIVNVVYGHSNGLRASGDQCFHQNSLSSMTVEEGDLFGRATAIGDFDGDGYDDLAVGVPGENDNKGEVNIIYGSTSKLTVSGAQIFAQSTSGLAGWPEVGDEFGAVLATGDFDGDDYDDLVVGVPSEAIGSRTAAGMVNVIYGSVNGLSGTGSQGFHQNSANIAGASESYDEFGAAIATGDFNGDGYDDLAVGVPGEDISTDEGSKEEAGLINVIFGSVNGLTSAGNACMFLTEGAPWYQHFFEGGERFGHAIATSDINQDGYVDLAIGAPGSDLWGEGTPPDPFEGQVFIVYSDSSGPQPGAHFIGSWGPYAHLDDGYLEYFGWSLAFGDFNGDGYDDLAVGQPGSYLNSPALPSAGLISFFWNDGFFLLPTDALPPSSNLPSFVHQQRNVGSDVLGDIAETFDMFGFSVTSGNFNDDAYDDIAIGVPLESPSGSGPQYGGAVNAVYGSVDGINWRPDQGAVVDDQFWHQNVSGICGANEAGDLFGYSVN
ncbi:MAG: hypothetical protein GY847_38965 [Proteobacteria bacterium]|nr:hypothetical protein [Pseudomonadota bacterium]